MHRKALFLHPKWIGLHFEKPSQIIFLKIHKAQRKKANFVFFFVANEWMNDSHKLNKTPSQNLSLEESTKENPKKKN